MKKRKTLLVRASEYWSGDQCKYPHGSPREQITDAWLAGYRAAKRDARKRAVVLKSPAPKVTP